MSTVATPTTNTTATGDSPAEVYRTGEARAKTEVSYWTARGALVSNTRLAAFAAIAVVAWLAFGTRSLPAVWLALPVLAFAALVVVHDRILRRTARAARLERFHTDGQARLEHRFSGRGDSGLRYLDPAHPYARDLDLSGRARSSSCSRRRARARAPIAWPPGSLPPPRPRRSARANGRSPSCALASTCAWPSR